MVRQPAVMQNKDFPIIFTLNGVAALTTALIFSHCLNARCAAGAADLTGGEWKLLLKKDLITLSQDIHA